MIYCTENTHYPYYLYNDSINTLDKGQDISFSGNDIDNFGQYTFMIVCDGHGSGNMLKQFSEEIWKQIIKNITRNLLKKIINKKIKLMNSYNDGFTFSLVKIYNNCIKCYWIGDSTINIYKNFQLIFKSTNHNSTSNEECLRVFKNFVCYKYINSFKILNNSTLIYNKQIQWELDNGVKTNLTRAFGNENYILSDLESATILYNSNNNIRVIIGSDGLWDMLEPTYDNTLILYGTVEDILNKVHERWNQSWKLLNKNKYFNIENKDDITASIFSHIIRS